MSSMSNEQSNAVAEEPEVVDGYGNPFPPNKQSLHLEYILASLNVPLDPTKQYEQLNWKEKPAGQYSKGSGV